MQRKVLKMNLLVVHHVGKPVNKVEMAAGAGAISVLGITTVSSSQQLVLLVVRKLLFLLSQLLENLCIAGIVFNSADKCGADN
jgi:hypothetical protein